jgi:hypothetical protein
MSREAPRYVEVQRFRQPWLWAIVAGVSGLLTGVFGYGIVQQLVRGRPWGDHPVSDTALVIIAALNVLVVGVGLPATFVLLKLVTEVKPDGIFVALSPIVRRHIPFDEIRSFAAKSYRPIRDYGGWGYRVGRKGSRAFNAMGDRGVEIELADGRIVMIGSQRAEALEQAIRDAISGAGPRPTSA